MKLDHEDDRALLLAIVNQGQFKGEIVEHVAVLKRRIATARVETPSANTPPPEVAQPE